MTMWSGKDLRKQPVLMRAADEGKGDIFGLMDWLADGNELNNRYMLLSQGLDPRNWWNCVAFGRDVFNNFAKTKQYRPLQLGQAFIASARRLFSFRTSESPEIREWAGERAIKE
jgi:hypothetical protein